MGLFSSIKKAVRSATKPVRSLAKSVAKVSSNNLVQAAVPVLSINSSVTASTVHGGPKAGFRAAEKALQNPVTRKAAAATAMVFPAATPVVVAQEAAIATLAAVKSKNPRVAAGAALQLAATVAQAKAGNPGAARALKTVKGVAKAGALLRASVRNPQLQEKVAASPAAQLLYLRTLDRALDSPNPKTRASAQKAYAELSATPEGKKLLAGIRQARTVQRTAAVRQFSVSKQGRVYKAGRLLRGR